MTDDTVSLAPSAGGPALLLPSNPRSVAGAVAQVLEILCDLFPLEAEKATQELIELREKANGLRPDLKISNPERRVDNLHGRTTYAANHLRSLKRIQAEALEQLAGSLPKALEAAARLAFAETAIKATEEIVAEKQARRAHYKAEGLYTAVADFADDMHETYGVTHHLYALATPDAKKAISLILRRSAEVEQLRQQRDAERAEWLARMGAE